MLHRFKNTRTANAFRRWFMTPYLEQMRVNRNLDLHDDYIRIRFGFGYDIEEVRPSYDFGYAVEA